ncbi:MAG: hypothetical protein ACI91J_002816, partial [Yoonia sp.]
MVNKPSGHYREILFLVCVSLLPLVPGVRFELRPASIANWRWLRCRDGKPSVREFFDTSTCPSNRSGVGAPAESIPQPVGADVSRLILRS